MKRAAAMPRIGRLVHVPVPRRLGLLYRPAEWSKLHPETTWRSESESEFHERESEVVLNDSLVEALGIQLLATRRGLYRIGVRGRIRKSENPERW